jgi:hemerythrin
MYIAFFGIIVDYYSKKYHGGYMKNQNTVEWDDAYSVGVDLIDSQHKELIRLTNKLLVGCSKKGESAEFSFMEAVQGAVQYTKTHFSTEEILMKRINYPEFSEHEKQHKDFVAQVLQQLKDFETNKDFSPLGFARFLVEWILIHIAKTDKKFGAYCESLRRQGQLDESVLVV